jgi:hypothetical protein
MLYRGKIPNGYCVLHRCDTPICVNPAHLFLGTQLENIEDRDQKKRLKPFRGETNGRVKLTEEQARYIIALSKQEGLPKHWRTRLAEELGVSISLVCYIIKGRNWRWLHEELASAENCNNKRADQRSL